jgi:hypothetical protein
MLFSCYRRCILWVFALFRRASDGADGSSGHGFNGTLNATSLASIFAFLDIYGKHFVDLGAGEGRVLVSAVACGAGSAIGYELIQNKAHKYVFDAVLSRVQRVKSLIRANWLPQDIELVCAPSIDRPDAALTIWSCRFLRSLCTPRSSIAFGWECLPPLKIKFWKLLQNVYQWILSSSSSTRTGGDQNEVVSSF